MKIKKAIKNSRGLDWNLFDELLHLPFGGIANYFLKKGDYAIMPRRSSTSPIFTIDAVDELHYLEPGDFKTKGGVTGPVSGNLFIEKTNEVLLLGSNIYTPYAKSNTDLVLGGLERAKIIHPQVRKMYLDHLSEIKKRLKKEYAFANKK